MNIISGHSGFEGLYDLLLSNKTPEELAAMTLSLMVISKKLHDRTYIIKKIDLDILSGLNQGERAQKFKNWKEQDRFAVVVEQGDKIEACVSPKMATNLKQEGKELTLDGKEVKVHQLNDSLYEELDRIADTFEESIRAPVKKEEKVDPAKISAAYERYIPSYCAIKTLKTFRFLEKMENVPNTIILKFLQKMGEAQREIDRIKAEEAKKRDEKHYEIKRQAIKEDTLEKEILDKEIKDSQQV